MLYSRATWSEFQAVSYLRDIYDHAPYDLRMGQPNALFSLPYRSTPALHRALDFPSGSSTIMRNPRASLLPPWVHFSYAAQNLRLRWFWTDFMSLVWLAQKTRSPLKEGIIILEWKKVAFCCSYRSRVKPKSIFKHLKFLCVLTECDVDVCVPYLTKICTADCTYA